MTLLILAPTAPRGAATLHPGTCGMAPLRAIIYGMGTVGRVAARFLADKGAEVVAGYSRSPQGTEAGLPGITLCTPEVPFSRFGADLVLFTHASTLADLWEPARRAAEAGLDAITVADEAFDPFGLGEDLPTAMALDRLFKSHGRRLAALGIQDSFWFAHPVALSAAAQRIDRVYCTNLCDLAQFGAATRAGLPLGADAAGFAPWAARQAGRRGAMEIALRPALRAMGLDAGRFTQALEPVFATEDLPLPAGLGLIRQGQLRGVADVVRFDCAGGVSVEGRFVSAWLQPGEAAFNEWRIEGLPDLVLRSTALQGAQASMASVINRIPDVLAAPAGFLGVETLGLPRHRRSLTRPQPDTTRPTTAEGPFYDQFRPQ